MPQLGTKTKTVTTTEKIERELDWSILNKLIRAHFEVPEGARMEVKVEGVGLTGNDWTLDEFRLTLCHETRDTQEDQQPIWSKGGV